MTNIRFFIPFLGGSLLRGQCMHKLCNDCLFGFLEGGCKDENNKSMIQYLDVSSINRRTYQRPLVCILYIYTVHFIFIVLFSGGLLLSLFPAALTRGSTATIESFSVTPLTPNNKTKKNRNTPPPQKCVSKERGPKRQLIKSRLTPVGHD